MAGWKTRNRTFRIRITHKRLWFQVLDYVAMVDADTLKEAFAIREGRS